MVPMKHGVLLFSYSGVFVIRRNMLSDVHMEFVLFQVFCLLCYGDDKRQDMNPALSRW